MSVPTVYVLVGIPGSGKSTYATQLAMEVNADIFSSDQIRGEIFKDQETQIHNGVVFSTLYKRVFNNIKDGKNCIIDATNTTMRARGSLFELATRNIDFRTEAIIIATPIDVCKKNNQSRERKVPEYVIEKHYRQFELPFLGEGYDRIRIIRHTSCGNLILPQVQKHMENFQLNDQIHTMPLDLHCKKCFEFCKKKSNDNFFLLASLVHDYGKIFTKSYNSESGICNYFGHSSAGAYELMTQMGDFLSYLPTVIDSYSEYEKSNKHQESALEFLFYICYHYLPNEWEKFPKVRESWAKKLPLEVYNNLNLLHKCNRYAYS